MSGIILVVEDLAEEQTEAKEVITQAGYRAAITGTLEDAFRVWKSLEGKLVGIITDLHFPEKTSDNPDWADPKKPCGLAIIAEATRRGMPVVVCSDINHHFCDYVKKVIDVLGRFHPAGRIPFVMDSKYWLLACKELQKILKEGGEVG